MGWLWIPTKSGYTYSTDVVVSILLSVYGHQQIADTPTVHYYCMLPTYLQATYDKCKFKSKTVPFLTAAHIQ